MAWISHDPDDDKSTPRFFAFRKKFNWPPYQALGFLCAFWINVLKSETYETGEISDWTGEFLADRIGVGNVDPNELWEALVEGYLEVKPDGRRLVRDWIKIAGPWLRQKYANREHGKERLTYIWSLHGLSYGREAQTRKSSENSPTEDADSGESRPKVGLQSPRPAPPDIIKEPPKDRERGGDASFLPPWETGVRKEAAPPPAARSKTRITLDLDGTEPPDRRETQAPPANARDLAQRFQCRLSEKMGEDVSFAFDIWGKYLKLLLAKFEAGEIERRFDHWLSSDDPFIRDALNNGGLFHQKFPFLKAGPILNRGRSNGRQPFDDGAATVRAESESIY